MEKTVSECANKAIETMEHLGQNPYPWLYELWFTYYAETTPALNTAIQAKGNLDIKACLELYRTHIGDKNSALQTLSDNFNIRKQELVAQAHTDLLTGLGNRRALENALNDHYAMKGASGIITLDLDYFKSINDRHGHMIGDEVLSAIGKILREETKGKDFVGRTGGEEFIILLADCNEEQATSFATSLLERISGYSFQSGEDKCFNISASAGVVSANLQPENQPRFMQAADNALYAAKASGRNRVVNHTQISKNKHVFDPQSLKQ